MAFYEISWKRSALKELKRLPKDIVRRVVSRVEALAEVPRPPGSRKLSGAERSYRLRVGQYRILYDIHDARLVIQVIRVAHRKDAYR